MEIQRVLYFIYIYICINRSNSNVTGSGPCFTIGRFLLFELSRSLCASSGSSIEDDDQGVDDGHTGSDIIVGVGVKNKSLLYT